MKNGKFNTIGIAALGIAALTASATFASPIKKSAAKPTTATKRTAKAERPLKPLEGAEYLAEGIAAFEEVCLDERGKIRDVAVTNAALLADPNGGAIDCILAAETLGQEMDRHDHDLELFETKMAKSGGVQ